MYDWLSLSVRWIHVVAAIAWIGHAFFFNWLEGSLEPRRGPEPEGAGGGEGDREAWLVHGGGFFHVVKAPQVARQILGRLHWFKWEAALTWLSGVTLLGVVYYMGGGALMIDPGTSPVGAGLARVIGAATIVVSWVVYDALWISPLANRRQIATLVSVGLLVAVAFALTQVLSGRAAYIHVGAVLGTVMAANVWMRIIPAQRQLVAAIEAGGTPSQILAARAKQRSRHNNYMAYPIIFIMISNHYHHTYGNAFNWGVLALLMIAGGGIRKLFNSIGPARAAAAAAAGAAAVAAIVVTAPADAPGPRRAATTAAGSADNATAPRRIVSAIDPALVGTVRGVAQYAGPVPAPRELSLVSGCREQHDGPVYVDDVLISGGKVRNVFVWIREGLEGWELPEPPTEPAVVDQVGCLYRPRVLGVQVGQPVDILNSDPLLHNVHAVTEANEGFNLAMPSKGGRITRVYWEPEVMTRLKCDVHPWMAAYIGVVPHGFFAVTGQDGAYTIEGLPAGTYMLEAWHEVLGRVTSQVAVRAGASADVDFTLPGPETGR
jgi:uncharacterized membrane protein/plastocyanin